MNPVYSTNRNFKRTFISVLRIFVILAMAFPAAGGVYAQEVNPRIVASITHDWFQAEEFSPGGTLNVKIYEEQGGPVLWEENRIADESGFMVFEPWQHPVDLKPGNYLVISDGATTRALMLEAVTVDVFDPSLDYVAGTAPPAPGGRPVWVWTGNDSTACSMDVIADPVSGAWEADFSTQPCDVTEDMGPAAQVFDEDGDASEGNLPLNPIFAVFPEWEAIEGWFWTQDATVHLEIDDPSTPESPDHVQDAQVVPLPWNLNDIWVRFDFAGVYDVKPGDVVTLSEGTISRTYTVENLAITGVHEVEDTVSGTAEEGETVYVWPHATGQQIEATASSEGAWEVDFTGIFDLVPGACGRSEVRDATGNSTAVDWCIPNPHFSAFPEWESIEGWDWPLGATIHLTIDDPATGTNPDYEDDQQVVVTPWDPNVRWVQFNFNGQYDMKVGDVVTLTDGPTPRTYTVRNLSITGVDPDTEIVSGMADEGATVYVWPHATGQQLTMTAGSRGSWEADFTGIFDIAPGEGGRAEVRDDTGNATAVDWYVLKPHFAVFPEWEYIEGWEWPAGAVVHLTIDDPATLQSPDYSGDEPVVPTPWDPNQLWVQFNFANTYDMKPGDIVSLDDGVTARAHTVRNLGVTAVDESADTVAGTAEAGETVHVWPHATGQQLQVMADAAGVWLADFSGVFDLVGGEGGRSEVRDEQGNSTAVDWYVPNPRFVVFPEWEWFDGLDWPDGATVTITVDGKPECTTAQQSPGFFFNGSFGEGCDLVIGDTVTFTDGVTTRTHTVRNLSVSDANAETDTVLGGADPGATVRVWPHGHDQYTLEITAFDDGTWSADFGSVGFNLVPGIYGRSQVEDEDGNATAVDWGVPLPGWQQINLSGFGNPLSRGVSALESFGGQVYAGASNWETGGEVWRLGPDGQWIRVNEPGFGSGAASPAIIDLFVFQGQLYAGTGWNNETPGQLWRSSNGTNWQPVTTDGFHDSDNIAITNFVAFKGMLYAGTGTIDSSAQIWRSHSGKPTSWERVAPDTSGLAGNVTGFAVYKNALYAAIEPAGGISGTIQVWRSMNGSDWAVVTDDGFGDPFNGSTGGFAQFGGYLYLGTRNEMTGAQLWRSSDGMHWEQAVGDGFGELNNIKIESLFIYDDQLHAATLNEAMGLQLWRSADGADWEQLTANGFGDSANTATLWNSATLQYQGNLLIGTWNDAEGGELWRFTP